MQKRKGILNRGEIKMDLCIGIDIGSTTTKIIALIPGDGLIVGIPYNAGKGVCGLRWPA